MLGVGNKAPFILMGSRVERRAVMNVPFTIIGIFGHSMYGFMTLSIKDERPIFNC
jgi:hypothetical protein